MSSRVDRVAGAGPKGSPSSLGLATVASFRLASLNSTQPPGRQEVAERSQSELTSNLLIPKEQRPMASIFSAGNEPNFRKAAGARAASAFDTPRSFDLNTTIAQIL